MHELAMNPDSFTGRTDEEILSTLAHEMAHVWQQTHGTAPRRSYHDRQWAAKMKEIGLQPTDTGEPGGKETGQSVTHYIVPGGPYAAAYAKLKATGFQLHWQSAPAGHEAKAKKASKTKFTCPDRSAPGRSRDPTGSRSPPDGRRRARPPPERLAGVRQPDPPSRLGRPSPSAAP